MNWLGIRRIVIENSNHLIDPKDFVMTEQDRPTNLPESLGCVELPLAAAAKVWFPPCCSPPSAIAPEEF